MKYFPGVLNKYIYYPLPVQKFAMYNLFNTSDVLITRSSDDFRVIDFIPSKKISQNSFLPEFYAFTDTSSYFIYEKNNKKEIYKKINGLYNIHYQISSSLLDNKKIDRIFSYNGHQIFILTEDNILYYYDENINKVFHLLDFQNSSQIHQAFSNSNLFVQGFNKIFLINSETDIKVFDLPFKLDNREFNIYNESVVYYSSSSNTINIFNLKEKISTSLDKEVYHDVKFVKDKIYYLEVYSVGEFPKIPVPYTRIKVLDYDLKLIDSFSVKGGYRNFLKVNDNFLFYNDKNSYDCLYNVKTNSIKLLDYITINSNICISNDNRYLFFRSSWFDYKFIDLKSENNLEIYQGYNELSGSLVNSYYDSNIGFVTQTSPYEIRSFKKDSDNIKSDLLLMSNSDIHFQFLKNKKIYYLENEILFCFDYEKKVSDSIATIIGKRIKIIDINNLGVIYYSFGDNRYYPELKYLYNESNQAKNIVLNTYPNSFNDNWQNPINYSDIVNNNLFFISNNSLYILDLNNIENILKIDFEKNLSHVSAIDENTVILSYDGLELFIARVNTKSSSFEILHKFNSISLFKSEFEDLDFQVGIKEMIFNQGQLVITSRFLNDLYIFEIDDSILSSVVEDSETKPKLNEVLNQPYDMITVYDIMGKMLFSSGEWQSDNNFYRKYNQPVIIQVQSANKYHIFKVINQ